MGELHYFGINGTIITVGKDGALPLSIEKIILEMER